MNPEKLPSEEQTSPVNKNPLFQVTKTSKYLAMLLFVLLPFVGGYVGYIYAPGKMVEHMYAPEKVVENMADKERVVASEPQNGKSQTVKIIQPESVLLLDKEVRLSHIKYIFSIPNDWFVEEIPQKNGGYNYEIKPLSQDASSNSHILISLGSGVNHFAGTVESELGFQVPEGQKLAGKFIDCNESGSDALEKCKENLRTVLIWLHSSDNITIPIWELWAHYSNDDEKEYEEAIQYISNSFSEI